jgi:hypothetical protein
LSGDFDLAILCLHFLTFTPTLPPSTNGDLAKCVRTVEPGFLHRLVDSIETRTHLKTMNIVRDENGNSRKTESTAGDVAMWESLQPTPIPFLVPAVDQKYEAKAKLFFRKKGRKGYDGKEVIVATNSVSLMEQSFAIELEELVKLIPGVWLSDRIINLVMGWFQGQTINADGTNAVMYLSTFFVEEIRRRKNSARHIRRMSSVRSSANGKKLYTIVNTREKTHWVAVEVCFELAMVTILDSMLPVSTSSPEYSELLAISVLIIKWCEEDPPTTRPDVQWTYKLCDQCPQQDNSCDCGLFALAAVAARSRVTDQKTSSEISAQRICIASWIVSLGDNNEKVAPK